MKRNVWYTLLLLTCTLVLVMGLCTLGAAAQEQVTEAESVLTETEAAEGATDNVDLGGFFSAQRIEWAIKVTLQGMLMVFAVLALLWGVVAVFKVFLHDIPAKKAAKQAALAKAVAEVVAPEAQPEVEAVPEEDEGEIVAAITAAIAAMLQSEEYSGQFASGFRVVSFTRKGGAWNKQN